jgi:hypothetical protein
MMSGPLINSSSKLWRLLNFHLLFYYDMAEAPSSTSTLELVTSFNFNSRRQPHPSSTSNLLANIIPRCHQLQPSSPFKFQTPSLCYFLPFFLMAVLCLMLLLPDELFTKIIIHSIKDVAIFHFPNHLNKIYGTFRRICNSDEVLLHVSLRDLHEACKNDYIRWCFEYRFCEANHLEALCFEGMVRLMRRRNPDQGLKLIGDAAAEDSGAKYFLAMLKYCCNMADPEAMALLQVISGGPSPPNGRWKNHNLRWLRYLVKQDLDNIAWWYWLDDGDDSVAAHPESPHLHLGSGL